MHDTRTPIEKLQVLVVEDNPTDLRLLEIMLGRLDEDPFELLHCETLGDGLAYARDHEVDAVLLDLYLPDSIGFDTFARFHAARPDLPVVVMTALHDQKLAREAVAGGAQDFLVKWEVDAPLIQKTLLYAIERARLINALKESRKREQEAHEMRFRKMIEQNADGMLIVGRDQMIRFANPAAVRLMGRRREHLVGSRFPNAINIGDAFELEWATPEAERLVVELRVATTMWEGEAVYLVSLRNMTARREMEEALRAAKERAEELARLKSTFLANMSHEIRTPLTIILGYSSVLVEDIEDPRQREGLQLIEKSGQRLMQTLNSVLDLAKLEMKGVVPEPGLEDLTGRARDIVELLRPAAEQKNLELRFQSQTQPTLVRAPKSILDRILQNLVDNAIKFTKHGSVEVRVEQDDQTIRLEVEDTGIGIGEGFMPRLFEAFTQESSGLNRLHEGSGLGLTITKRLVDLIEGHIEVRSEKGRGSCFVVTLPVPEVQQEMASGSTSTQ